MTLSRSFLERRQQAVAQWLIEDTGQLGDEAPVLELFSLDEDSVAAYRPGMGVNDEHVAPFRHSNATVGPPKSREDRDARLAMVRRQIPSVTYGTAEIRRIFNERPEVFRSLVRILVDTDAAQDSRPGKPGNRPAISTAEASRRMLRLFGLEFSTLPFCEALKVLAGGRSIRHLAAKVGLERTQAHRLLTGERIPTGADMEQVARAFAVHPSYFLEWRVAFVVCAVLERMDGSPETVMNLYSKLVIPATAGAREVSGSRAEL